MIEEVAGPTRDSHRQRARTPGSPTRDRHPRFRFDRDDLSSALPPGNLSTKSAVFESLLALANPGATVFGATLLNGGVTRNWYARRVMAFNNDRGIFSNTADDLVGLESLLSKHLDQSSVRIMGCVALFSGEVGRGVASYAGISPRRTPPIGPPR